MRSVGHATHLAARCLLVRRARLCKFNCKLILRAQVVNGTGPEAIWVALVSKISITFWLDCLRCHLL